jgi:hypothetical protein
MPKDANAHLNVPEVPMSSASSESSISRVFQEKFVYPKWVTKQKYKFYEKLEDRLKKLRYVHSRSAEHYEKMNVYIFGPSITITALSGIASFLSTSDFIDADARNGLGVTVGVLASISSMLQAVASASKYHAKIESHRSAAEQFNTLLTRLRFEMELPNEENFTDEIEKQIIEIKNKCNFFSPQFIIDEYQVRQREKRMNGEKRGSKNKYRELSDYSMINSDTVIDINTEEVVDGVNMEIGSYGRQDNSGSASVSGQSGLGGSGGDNGGAENNAGESSAADNGSSVV